MSKEDSVKKDTEVEQEEGLHVVERAALSYGIHDLKLLRKAITYKLTGTDLMLFIYYDLNCNHKTGASHRIPTNQVMRDLNISRTTLYRSHARLEDAGILPPTDKLGQEYTVCPRIWGAGDVQEESTPEEHQQHGSGAKQVLIEKLAGRVEEFESKLDRSPDELEMGYLRTFSDNDFRGMIQDLVQTEKPS